MRAAAAAVLATLAIALSPLACAPDEALDHEWDDAHCTLTGVAVVPGTQPTKASAYLLRHAGAAALVVQLSPGGNLGDPFTSEPTTRIALPPSATPGPLTVKIDASDVRGPRVVAAGTAWAISTTGVKTDQPYDNWQFGSGTLTVGALTITENDTSSRDDLTLDVTLDLSQVQVAPLAVEAGAPPASPQSIGGTIQVRCADNAAPQ